MAEATPVIDAPDDAAPALTTPEAPWILYLLECAGERLYAGVTNDLAARFKAHCAGRGARFTRAFPPLRIAAASQLGSRSLALKAEHALKRQPRRLKLDFLAACGTRLALEDSDALKAQATIHGMAGSAGET